jgi:N-acetylmuramic acid 6-phosphate etherase
MVDVRATNAKLEARAVTIVSDIADVDLGAARRALAEAGGEAKTAALMLMAGMDALAARERLRSAEGSLRAALGPDPSPAH